jgi:hypothetical protein
VDEGAQAHGEHDRPSADGLEEGGSLGGEEKGDAALVDFSGEVDALEGAAEDAGVALEDEEEAVAPGAVEELAEVVAETCALGDEADLVLQVDGVDEALGFVEGVVSTVEEEGFGGGGIRR